MNRAVRPGDREAAAEHLARLIRIPTVSSSDDEVDTERFDHIARELEAMYPLLAERCTITRVGRRCIQYRWDPPREPAQPEPPQPESPQPESAQPESAQPQPPSEPAQPEPPKQPSRAAARATGPLVLMAHADVVPADAADGWRHEPFAGVIADGSVHGRGALDDKGPLVAIFEASESLAAEGFEPAQPLIISIGGDEETLGSGGADAAQAIEESGGAPWLVLDEGGAVVDPPLPFVRGDSAMIGICEKGYASLRLRAVAEPGHSSTPSGPSAPDRLARAITRLQRRPFPAHVSQPARAMLTRLADGAPGASRRIVRALAACGPLTARLFAAIGGEPAALVRTTCAVTMLRAGTAANVSAPDATATLNLRIAPGETVARTIRRIRRVIRDRTISIEVLAASEPTPVAPIDGEQFAAIGDAITASHPGARPVPYLVMATTDSRHFHRRWPHVYRFAPVTMTSAQRASIHGVDEHITIDALGRAIDFHRALIRDSLAAPRAEDDAARHAARE